MLSNEYFLAKFRFDTAENEPAKNLQKHLCMFEKCLAGTPPGHRRAARDDRRQPARRHPRGVRGFRGR